MGKPAARIGDMHMCPMVTPGTPPIPHVGGPITGPGVPTVMIGGVPAAVMGDMCTCVGPPDTIVLGSAGVMIGGKPAARMGDQCAHGGAITVGCPTVLIGEIMADAAPVIAAPLPLNKSNTSSQTESNIAGHEKALSSKQLAKIANIVSLTETSKTNEKFAHKHTHQESQIQYTLINSAGKPMDGQTYEIKTSDGKVHKGRTDGAGKTQLLNGYTEADCKVLFFK